MRNAIACIALAAFLAGCTTPPGTDGTGTAPAATTTTPGSVSPHGGTPAATSTSAPAPGPDPCADATREGLELADEAHTVVALSTSKGCIVAELYDDKAPITVGNFRTYVEEGFYEDLVFHRVIKGFMSQTGGAKADGTFKQATHPAIKNEAVDSGLKNKVYTLAMARLGAACQGCPDQPDSATNQFFVNAADNGFLDPGGSTAAGYAVFGIVVQGRDVADAINSVPVHRCASGETSCPDTPVHFRAARLLA